MADTVTSQTIVNGARNLVMKFTDESDGTGESAVVKVDGTDTTLGSNGVAPGIHLKVARVEFAISGGSVRVKWNASSPTDMLILAGFGTFDFTFFGGLPNPNAAGADGKITFTTVGFQNGSSYTITLEMIKAV